MESLLMLVVVGVFFIVFAIVVGIFFIVGAPVLVTLVTGLTYAMKFLVASCKEEMSATTAKQKMLASWLDLDDAKLLVVVPSDHWLFPVLCQAKRVKHAEALQRLEDAETVLGTDSTQELKTKLLTALLPDLKREHLRDEESITALSNRVVSLASVFSQLLPEYEPLLVEVALAHCLHEWTASRKTNAVDDAEAFEVFLMAALQSEQAQTWFNCQLIIDTLGVLGLSRHFYKEKISAQDKPLRDIISTSIVESYGEGDFSSLFEFQARLGYYLFVRKENKAALDAWTAWLGEEIATVGVVPQCPKTPTSLAMLSDRVINPTHFRPNKRAYFPFGMILKGIGWDNFGDLSGIINRRSKAKGNGDDGTEIGFICEGGELLAMEATAPIKKVEEEYEVVEDTDEHPHTD